MAINIIERAITPYNSSTNKVSQKERYSLYAPTANVNKVGMAGYDPRYFAVREQIVELSVAFLNSILHHKVTDETVDVDGIKDNNTLYSQFEHDVIVRRDPNGNEIMDTIVGSVLVTKSSATDTDTSYIQTETFFADGYIWTRCIAVTDGIITLMTDFEPIDDKYVPHDELGVTAVWTDNLKDAAVTTDKIADQNVTTSKIKDDAVTTVKLYAKAVTTEKINDSAVTTDKIADQNVTTEKLADSAVTTEKINDSAVTTPKIYTGAVTEEKLSTALINRLLYLEENAFTDIHYNTADGVLTFTSAAGTEEKVDLPLELLLAETGSYYDEDSQDLVLVLANGQEIAIPLDDITGNLIEYIDSIRDSIFVLQVAPPLGAMASAVLLTTPTLAIIAGISQ